MKWLIKQYMTQAHIETFKELCKLTGLSVDTLSKRILRPNTFKLFELIELDKVLHFSDEDLLKLARGQF